MQQDNALSKLLSKSRPFIFTSLFVSLCFYAQLTFPLGNKSVPLGSVTIAKLNVDHNNNANKETTTTTAATSASSSASNFQDSAQSSENAVTDSSVSESSSLNTSENVVSPSLLISQASSLNHAFYGISVDKQRHKLTLFRLDDDGVYSVVKTYNAITGKKQGDKKYRGDRRTPDGIYFVVGEKEGSDLVKKMGAEALKYGPRAFVLDYPNIYDQLNKKSGSGIWIHGVKDDTRILKPFDTEGCVALANSDLLDLSNYIVPFETPVVIANSSDDVPWDEVQNKRGDILNFVNSWRAAWENMEMDTYLSFYSKNFMSGNFNKSSWAKLKKNIHDQEGESVQVEIESPKILAFKDQVLVEFVQKYVSHSRSDVGRKLLYLIQEGNEYKVLSEKWYGFKNVIKNEDHSVSINTPIKGFNQRKFPNKN